MNKLGILIFLLALIVGIGACSAAPTHQMNKMQYGHDYQKHHHGHDVTPVTPPVTPSDTVAPVTTSNLASGSYNSLKDVTLTATDNQDANPTVKYSTDGITYNSAVKTTTISLKEGTTTLNYYAVDSSGNKETLKTNTYIITLPVTPPTTGTTYNVNSGGNIQNAINNAKDGDTVLVGAGTYSGFSISKAINVLANGIVNINSPISISGTGATLNGFIIKADYAVALSSTKNVSILNNKITTLGQTNAIMDTGINTNLHVAGNTIIGGDMLYGNGMAFEGQTSNSLIENNIISNTLHGILFDVASNNDIIKGNTVIGNGLISNGEAGIDYQGAGIYTIIGSTGFQILNNVVSGERDGIAIQPLGTGDATGMIVQGNTLNNNINGLWMQMNNAIINANTFNGNINAIDITGTGNLIENNIIKTSSNCDVALTTSKNTDVNTLSGNIGATKFYNVGPGKVIGE